MNPYLENHDPDAPVAFGRLINAWFKQNGWAQEIAQEWCRANDLTGPSASQISLLTRGKLSPKPFFFVQLHAFNLAVAEGRPGPMESHKAAAIICGDALRRGDGTPLTVGDFFELYLGVQTPNLLKHFVQHAKPLA